MATLDLSEAFDYSFMTPLMLKRPRRSLDASGEWQDMGFIAQSFMGVVIPISTDSMTGSVPEWYTTGITVYTQQEICNERDDAPADIIIYKGLEYSVTRIEDYSNWGSGWCKAEAHLIKAAKYQKIDAGYQAQLEKETPTKKVFTLKARHD